MTELRHDLTRTILAILFIAALIAGSVWILRPFLPAMIWAAMLAIATWPILKSLQARLWNSRALAVTLMTLSMFLVFVMPFWLAIRTIVHHTQQIIDWVEHIAASGLPPLPAWIAGLPLLGSAAADAWKNFRTDGVGELLQQSKHYAADVTHWFFAAMGDLGSVLLQFLLTVAIVAIIYARGERAAALVRQFGARLAGSRGEQAVVLAGQAVRGVALGVVVTAFIQATIGTVGLVLAGIPYAGLLCGVMFMLCVAQLGPGVVLIPAIIWLFADGETGSAIVLTVFTVFALGTDNFIRPLLIRRGVDLPLLLILGGVIGGLIAFGLIGIFLGPMVLAVAYTLFNAWLADADAPETRA